MRRIPSNRMPPYQTDRCGLRCALALCVFVSLLVYLFWLQPLFLFIFAAVAAYSVAEVLFDRKRIQRNCELRKDESLCTFVRSFDYRTIDTWIFRAVYEQVQPLVQFPIRKTDKLRKDLRLDVDDIDDVGEEIAQRTSRQLKNTQDNPYFDQVETVEDLVLFFSHQPRSEVV